MKTEVDEELELGLKKMVKEAIKSVINKKILLKRERLNEENELKVVYEAIYTKGSFTEQN